MDPRAETLIYCNYEQPGGIERVSLRLRDFLHRKDHSAELVSLFGDPIFNEDSVAISRMKLRGRSLVFSRKGDLREMGYKALGADLVYWRHIPVIQTGFRRWVEIGFIAWMSWRARVVCVCDDLAAEICALPFVRATGVTTCYSPVGPSLPENVPIRTPGEGTFRLAYFGRPGPQKRIDLVLWQVAHARAAGLDIELTVYGYEEQPVAEVPEGVTFAGSVDDPLAALHASDAVILISEYEGFPTVMIEAAMTGTPIIANDFRTGLADFERLIGPVTVIDESNPNALAEAVGDLHEGVYSLMALQDRQLTDDWLTVLKAEDFE